MDRYVLVVALDLEPKGDNAKDFEACSLNGSPTPPKWYFAIQACCGTSQFCSSEWEELGSQKTDSEEAGLSTMESCNAALHEQEGQDETQMRAELFEEAAVGLDLLADKLPPPGRSLLDVVVVCPNKEVPGLKEFLPVVGSLKHMQAWFSAKTTIISPHFTRWQKTASFLSACVTDPDPGQIAVCIDEREAWRGRLLVREKKFVSELKFDGFCLRTHRTDQGNRLFSSVTSTDQHCHSEVFHYYQPVLELLQLVKVSDMPLFLHSDTEFELSLSSTSVRGQLLLDQLQTLRGKVGAVFSLSCVVSAVSFPPASQLSTAKWREIMAKRPSVLPAPDVEVKGERGHYLLLVQGAESGGACTARLMHTANQINGAVAVATVSDLMKERVLASTGTKRLDATAAWLRSLPCLRGDQLLVRERRLAEVQSLVLKEYRRRRQEAKKPAAVPVNDLKVLLSLAREQYLTMHEARLPRTSECLPVEKENQTAEDKAEVRQTVQPEWPDRSVLQNYENLQKSRQKSRSGLFSTGSSESLMGPKDRQRTSCSLLDARELLKHFTPDGLPAVELQPLPVHRGDHTFRLSPDLTPRKVTKLPFRKATSSHYHGIEFCLDEQKALERDYGFVRLQSRLIRYETQTTCSKEPCPVPFALSPAPSPAVLSEPGSVPDGETLQAEPSRLKRRSHDPDVHLPNKRLVRSESDLGVSQGAGGVGSHPAVSAVKQQMAWSQSTSGSVSKRPKTGSEPHNHASARNQKPSQAQTESRSQKHNRMLREVVERVLKHHGIASEHACFKACCERLFEISKFYLKDLKTSRGLHDEMKKAASSNAKQVIAWVLERASEKE
ncbi:mdm2-binding protein [Chanos chanos]|uniref:Mdm2-binding protein n=1 Tax=Chanos chanos TaxID=29144 RepID=A0A6J2W4N8_CHACN|nr:mdm2-binding protein [Chanos chanos]